MTTTDLVGARAYFNLPDTDPNPRTVWGVVRAVHCTATTGPLLTLAEDTSGQLHTVSLLSTTVYARGAS